MAAVAADARMGAAEDEIRQVVAKVVLRHDVSIPAFVIRMAGNAVASTRRVRSTVKPATDTPVFANALVAARAKLIYSDVGTGIVDMAGRALTFEFRVPVDDPSWHHKLFQALRERGVDGNQD